jgi:hypothetical protein
MARFRSSDSRPTWSRDVHHGAVPPSITESEPEPGIDHRDDAFADAGDIAIITPL